MLEALNDSILAFGRHAKARGKSVSRDHQGMIAVGDERGGQPIEQSGAVVCDRADLAVHRSGGADHAPAECLANALMPETDAQYGNRTRGRANQFDGNSGAIRITRSRRNHDAGRARRQRFLDGQGIVTAHFHIGTQFTEVVKQVVSEAIVVIDEEEHAV